MTSTTYTAEFTTTAWAIGDETMTTRQYDLGTIHCGDTKTLTIESIIGSGVNKGQHRDVDEATFLIYDPDRTKSGTATGGSTTTLVDATLTQAESFWVGMPINITIGAATYQTEITAFNATTDTLTFRAIPEAVSADDTYEILGWPTMAQAAGTVSGNTGTLVLDATNCTDRPGYRTIVYRPTFNDAPADVEEYVMKLRVLASAYV